MAREKGVALGGAMTATASSRRIAEMDEEEYERLDPESLVQMIRSTRDNGGVHAHR